MEVDTELPPDEDGCGVAAAVPGAARPANAFFWSESLFVVDFGKVPRPLPRPRPPLPLPPRPRPLPLPAPLPAEDADGTGGVRPILVCAVCQGERDAGMKQKDSQIRMSAGA